MKHILAILAVAVALLPQSANAQTNTQSQLLFGRSTPAIPAVKLIPLPPVEYDHAYAGQLNITKWDDYSLIRMICDKTPNAIACSYRTYKTETGEPVSCLIMLGPLAQTDPRALRHEIGHCNGWSDKHEGARQ